MIPLKNISYLFIIMDKTLKRSNISCCNKELAISQIILGL